MFACVLWNRDVDVSQHRVIGDRHNLSSPSQIQTRWTAGNIRPRHCWRAHEKTSVPSHSQLLDSSASTPQHGFKPAITWMSSDGTSRDHHLLLQGVHALHLSLKQALHFVRAGARLECVLHVFARHALLHLGLYPTTCSGSGGRPLPSNRVQVPTRARLAAMGCRRCMNMFARRLISSLGSDQCARERAFRKVHVQICAGSMQTYATYKSAEKFWYVYADIFIQVRGRSNTVQSPAGCTQACINMKARRNEKNAAPVIPHGASAGDHATQQHRPCEKIDNLYLLPSLLHLHDSLSLLASPPSPSSGA